MKPPRAAFKVRFTRPLTGETGDVSDVRIEPRIKSSGLTLAEAEAVKRELESWPLVATHFYVVLDDNQAGAEDPVPLKEAGDQSDA